MKCGIIVSEIFTASRPFVRSDYITFIRLSLSERLLALGSTRIRREEMINREGSSSSRFHIIKIDTGPYKRGRWNCRDFDESTSAPSGGVIRSDMIVFGPKSGSSSESSGRPSFHIITEENGPVLVDHPVLSMDHHAGSMASKPPLPNRHPTPLPIPSSLTHSQYSKSITHTDSSHSITTDASVTAAAASSKIAVATTHVSSTIQQEPVSVSSAPPASTSLPNIAQHQQSHQRSQSPVIIPPPSTTTTSVVSSTITTPAASAGRFQVRPVDLNNAAAAILDSIVGSMQNDNHRIVLGGTSRQQGSVISFTPVTSASTTGPTAVLATVDGSAGGGSSTVTMGHVAPGSAGSNVIAIDNKIEQAMDLVKTHLLYAVREEVEVLKEKIIDLEKKVFRLETENKLLREYAPPEILQQIQQPSQSSNVSSSGLGVSTSHSSNASSNSLTPPQQHQSTYPSSTQAFSTTNARPPVHSVSSNTIGPSTSSSSSSQTIHHPHQ